MKYLSVSEISKIWGISERSVRDYCNKGRVIGAVLEGKKWLIPSNASKPVREVRHIVNKRKLIDVLKEEKESKISGGIYHKLQIEMTYNSNHIEGSKLSIDQTRFIFETKTIGITNEVISIDDIIETSNHFRCIDFVIDNVNNKLSESFIKQLHLLLKTGTSDSRKNWFKVGDYKLVDNEVGGIETTLVKDVKKEMVKLLKEYNDIDNVTVNDIIDFHYKFERIHPFQDGNGRVGRLIMFKECLKHNIVPILINENMKYYYYRGLKEYSIQKGFLIDTCLFGQDIIKKYLDYFNIIY